MPARPDSGMDMRQGPSRLGPKTDDTSDGDADDQDDEPMEGKEDNTSELDLGALESDVDEILLLRTPSSFMSSTKVAPASLSPVDPVCLAVNSRRGDAQKLLHIEEN